MLALTDVGQYNPHSQRARNKHCFQETRREYGTEMSLGKWKRNYIMQNSRSRNHETGDIKSRIQYTSIHQKQTLRSARNIGKIPLVTYSNHGSYLSIKEIGSKTQSKEQGSPYGFHRLRKGL